MKRRMLTIFLLHLVALIFIGFAYYSTAQSRPFGGAPVGAITPGAIAVDRGPLGSPKPGSEPPPYLSALPLANEIPSPLKMGPEEIGVGTKKFHRPGLGGIRLDWCAGPGPHRGCGPPAAQLFCQHQGYSRAVSMVEEQGVGLGEQTRRIASNTSCRGPDCSGFLAITCSNSK
ncbi:MAG: hypothetical protein V4691_08185 [Pseudomonadota bacterium]